ncbi:MAG TPA: hypothetical protein VMV69_20625 [Pirellulales bacterium]|nr:hypothetical protein [Pirellulales bacterium]
MNLILELPPELETQLAAEAAQLRLPISEYALRLLAVGRIQVPTPRSGAELLAYWQGAGLVGTRPDIEDAPAHVRALRRQSEKRERL